MRNVLCLAGRHQWQPSFRDGDECVRCGAFTSSETLSGNRHITTWSERLQAEYQRGLVAGCTSTAAQMAERRVRTQILEDFEAQTHFETPTHARQEAAE